MIIINFQKQGPSLSKAAPKLPQPEAPLPQVVLEPIYQKASKNSQFGFSVKKPVLKGDEDSSGMESDDEDEGNDDADDDNDDSDNGNDNDNDSNSNNRDNNGNDYNNNDNERTGDDICK